MSVPVKLASFALGLLACFGIGLGIGVVVGPIGGSGGGSPQPTHTQPMNGH